MKKEKTDDQDKPGDGPDGKSQETRPKPGDAAAAGTPPPADDLLRTKTGDAKGGEAKTKPIKNPPYAVDRVVMECPFCTSRDTRRTAPPKNRTCAPGFIWAHCQACGRDFKVKLSAPEKKS
jgi:hypothetical protein